MGKLNKFIREILINFGIGEREMKHMHIDEESVKTKDEVHALATENVELKGERDKLKSVVSKYDENKRSLQSEENIKAKIIKDKQRIDEKQGDDYLSLNSLLNRISKGMITATTWNKKKKLGRVTKLGLTETGDFIIFGEGNKKLISGQPRDIFFNPAGLITETEMGLLPLGLNEKNEWMQNIMDLEIPEYIITPQGKLQFKTASTKPVYEIIGKKDREKNKWKKRADESELLNQEYSSTIEKLESDNTLLREGLNNTKANYKEANKSVIEILKAFYPTEKRLLTLSNQTSAQEEDLDSQTNIIEKLIKKTEREMLIGSDRRSMDMLLELRETIVGEIEGQKEMERQKESENAKKEIAPTPESR